MLSTAFSTLSLSAMKEEMEFDIQDLKETNEGATSHAGAVPRIRVLLPISGLHRKPSGFGQNA